jgi:DnaK suppressor protein
MTHISIVKASLEAKLAELMRRAADIETQLSNPGSSDWEENATESEDDDVLSGVGSVTKTEIREIKLALNRIETGDYGKCIGCGESIPKARMEALPFVSTCVKCA